MDEQQIFSIEEANELIPLLSIEFERIFRLRNLVEDHLRVLHQHGIDIDPSNPLDRKDVPDACWPGAVRVVQMVKEIGNTVERINEAGCLVRDLDLGLINFFSIIEGEPVYLCWQYGEQEVSFFHSIEEDYEERRKISEGKTEGIIYN